MFITPSSVTTNPFKYLYESRTMSFSGSLLPSLLIRTLLIWVATLPFCWSILSWLLLGSFLSPDRAFPVRWVAPSSFLTRSLFPFYLRRSFLFHSVALPSSCPVALPFPRRSDLPASLHRTFLRFLLTYWNAPPSFDLLLDCSCSCSL